MDTDIILQLTQKDRLASTLGMLRHRNRNVCVRAPDAVSSLSAGFRPRLGPPYGAGRPPAGSSQSWESIRVLLAHSQMPNMDLCGLSGMYTRPAKKSPKVNRGAVDFGALFSEARNAMFGPPV